MAKKNKAEEVAPTKAELEALKILWEHGPSTVRFIHDILTTDTKTVRYTSTLKMMQLMTEKGMVKRDETNMTHIYYPLLEEKKTMGLMAKRFVHSIYNGSISSLLVAFMHDNEASQKELQQLKDVLSKMGKGK